MAVATTAKEQRLDRARQAMSDEGVDLLLASPSSDLVYLIGYAGHASERPTLLALRSGRPALMVMPQLEAPRLEPADAIQVLPYGETDDPYRVLADALADAGPILRVALSDQAWASVLLRLQRTFPEAEFMAAGPILRQLRMRKSGEEIEFLARAGAMADAAFAEMVTRRFAGRTEQEVAQELRDLLRAQGLRLSDWGPIVASGPNGASPHHMTGNRTIQEGDAVVMDFGGTIEGYHADITRTVHVGDPQEEFRRVYEAVRQAQQTGVDTVRPGVPAEQVDVATRAVIEAAGYGDFFIHRTGHGIGLDGHEEPYVVAGNRLPLEPGMTFSIEPGIYLPGRFGVRIEDIVGVTEHGVRRFNNASRHLTVVG